MLRALSTLGARPLGRPPAQFLLLARGRKTRHDPPAKSKIGRVATPPAVDPAELFVLTERYRQYRQTVRALRKEFVTEVRRKVHEARAGVLAERKALQDAAEHRELMAWNKAENQRLHELRLGLSPLPGWPGCGRRRGSRSGGKRRRRLGKPERRRPGPSSRSGKCCSCRRMRKTSSPERIWRRGWKKLWTPRRATIGPSPERGWWSSHSTRAPEAPVRTVPTQGPWK
uniref:Small ribosomal subunit protein mS26 n=1 Tax=Capra hircus TaxID=9925 RepID=A0A8C2P820_CAPHI